MLRWGLDEQDVKGRLGNHPLIVSAQAAEQDVSAWLDRLRTDIAGDEETRAIAMLETEALVRRLLRAARTRPASAPIGRVPGDHTRHSAAMARYLASHFREPISASDAVGAVHLNSRYAMTLFRTTVGMTLGAYLTRCRVAEAQRLLITTSMTTSEIAVAAGFGSQSSFYSHFGRETGGSPGAYRRTH